ncbi:hypothetical protein GCK72_001699 [Caenorhabditis remanei]|uniref:Glycosyltransferase family 92 protein n=1 Tax=Caenorhabditis remanei TaxID=31234 RepID=A0A6A5HVT9_CAERE|nr:hypothetical protein GCK72_001699 [Caenorhabditis remanei]KAF1769882.1 hypothetical protein GCK72_001699 [Caenorhabditis remanei]
MKTAHKSSGKLIILFLLVSVPWTSSEESTPAPTTEPTVPPAVGESTTAVPQQPPPPTTKLESYNFEGPLTEMRGSYTLPQMMNYDKGRPGWASIWSVNVAEKNFGVYFWPPKYCHAIYLCAVTSKSYNAMNQFDEFDCDNKFLKYYPHIQLIKFRKDNISEIVEKFYVESALQFQQTADNVYTLKALKANPRSYTEWIEMLKKPESFENLDWNLEKNDLLILTNSRMCEVNKPGLNGFIPIFHHSNMPPEITKNWPQWLPNQEKTDKFYPTVTLAATGHSKKDVDLLDYLKGDNMIHSQTTLGNANQHCSNYEKVSVFGARKPVYEHSPFVSTATYEVFQPNLNVAGQRYTMELEFEMNNCQWIRFWATDQHDMSEYKKMKPEDTMDLFIQEGFYLPPDSNEPVPLPDVHLMSKIKFTILKDAASVNDDHELIEFSFGNVNDNYLFHHFFRSKSFGKKTFKLHMIRSPRCESNIVIDGGFKEKETTDIPNLKDVKSCLYTYSREK